MDFFAEITKETEIALARLSIRAVSLEDCRQEAFKLARMLEKVGKTITDPRGNISESIEFANSIVYNMAGAIRDEAIQPCTCGKCDSCVAARSDEHHDRKTDGEIIQFGSARK